MVCSTCYDECIGMELSYTIIWGYHRFTNYHT